MNVKLSLFREDRYYELDAVFPAVPHVGDRIVVTLPPERPGWEGGRVACVVDVVDWIPSAVGCYAPRCSLSEVVAVPGGG